MRLNLYMRIYSRVMYLVVIKLSLHKAQFLSELGKYFFNYPTNICALKMTMSKHKISLSLSDP